MRRCHTLYIVEGRHRRDLMASKSPSDVNLALACMRSALNWKQSELAEAAGIRSTTISDFERGNRAFPLERLIELAGVLGLPLEAVAQARAFVRSMEQQAQPPGDHGPDAGADHRSIERIAAQAGLLASDFARGVLGFVTFETRSVAARQQARFLWQRMRKLSPAQRRSLVEKDREAPELGSLRAGLQGEHQGGGRQRRPRPRAGGSGSAHRGPRARQGELAPASPGLRLGPRRQRPAGRGRPAGGGEGVRACRQALGDGGGGRSGDS